MTGASPPPEAITARASPFAAAARANWGDHPGSGWGSIEITRHGDRRPGQEPSDTHDFQASYEFAKDLAERSWTRMVGSFRVWLIEGVATMESNCSPPARFADRPCADRWAPASAPTIAARRHAGPRLNQDP